MMNGGTRKTGRMGVVKKCLLRCLYNITLNVYDSILTCSVSLWVFIMHVSIVVEFSIWLLISLLCSSNMVFPCGFPTKHEILISYFHQNHVSPIQFFSIALCMCCFFVVSVVWLPFWLPFSIFYYLSLLTRCQATVLRPSKCTLENPTRLQLNRMRNTKKHKTSLSLSRSLGHSNFKPFVWLLHLNSIAWVWMDFLCAFLWVYFQETICTDSENAVIYHSTKRISHNMPVS